MSSKQSTSLKVPVFNGEEIFFQSWWIKFQVYACVKGFHGVLKDPGLTISEADIELLENKPLLATGGAGARSLDKERQLKLVKKNLTAMAHLKMGLGTKAVLNNISTISTTDWPRGLAFELVDLLEQMCTKRLNDSGTKK